MLIFHDSQTVKRSEISIRSTFSSVRISFCDLKVRNSTVKVKLFRYVRQLTNLSEITIVNNVIDIADISTLSIVKLA